MNGLETPESTQASAEAHENAAMEPPRTSLVAFATPGLKRWAEYTPSFLAPCYAASHYPGWRAELYLELPHGAFGENFTVGGMDEATVCIGDAYEVGVAVVQVTQPRTPCWKIARRWQVKDLSARVQRSGRTGWYLRVLREGEVAAGDEMRRIDRPHPEWTIARANAALYTRPVDEAGVRALAACPGLAASLRGALSSYLAQQLDPVADGDAPRLVGPNAD